MPDAKDRFQVHFSDAIDVCDFVLTNSQYVAGDVERYLQEAKGRHIPVKAVVLPTELKVTQSRNIPRNKNIKFIGNTEYVLCVSTIEVRKNHSLLISVWEKLFEELGDKTPYLVLVGKWGWQIDEFRKYIEEKGYVGDWLFIFNGISDVEMEYLYRHSLFTVYPSFAEGFGLPIGESLVYGKPCIASNTTSMPEVGGDFVRYIDPFDWKAAYPTIRQPIFDRADLKQWTERIQQEFKPKRWADFCEEFFHAVVDCAEETDNNEVSSLVPLPPNLLINGGDYDILIGALEKKPLITFRAARFNNWHPSEHWGVWSSDRRCEISFRSPFSEGETADIFFQLRRAPSQDLDPFVIVDAGLGKQKITLTEHPTFYRFTGVVGENGSLHIRFLARGKFPANDGRGIYIGWSGLAYCRHDDPAAQAVTLAALVPSGTSLQTTNLN
nr:glycosyltransferase [Komagataeibacter sp. FNDCR2]